MAGLTRRDALKLATAAAAATALPSIPFAAPAAPVAALEPAWIVGTPGEYNWQFMRGLTEEAARLAYVQEETGLDKCEDGGSDPDDCDCEFCCHFRDVEGSRVKEWDNRPGTPNAGDWLRAGFGHICSRCSYETSREEGGRAVNDNAVCSDCMTLADWDIVDPEHAAELRAELADEEQESAAPAAVV